MEIQQQKQQREGSVMHSRRPTHITNDDPLTPGELALVEWIEAQSPEEGALAVAFALSQFDQVPSYLDRQLRAHRGLLESIASQP
jgi:hypothetical protein